MPVTANPTEPQPRVYAPKLNAMRRLVARRIKAAGWSRLARLAVGLVCAVCLASMLVVRRDAHGDLGAIAVRALGWASWLVALPVTLGAISGLASLRDDRQLSRTLRSFGIERAQADAHALLACIRVVFSYVGIPGIGSFALALVLSRTWADLPVRALQLAAGTTYVVALACFAGIVAVVAARLGAKRGRWLTLLLLLGPMLVSDRALDLADLPRALSQILDGIARLGAA